MARQPSVKQQFLASPQAQAAARLYLAQRGYSVPKSPAQLYRYASQVGKAEVAGTPLPTQAELRGHAEEVKVQHIDQDSIERRREHYFLKRTEKLEKRAAVLREAEEWDELRAIQFTHDDFAKLVRAVQKADKLAGHTRQEWPLIVRGWARTISGPPGAVEFIKGAQVSATDDTIVYYERRETQDSLPLIDFLNFLYADREGADGRQLNGIDWVDIQQIAIPLFYENVPPQ